VALDLGELTAYLKLDDTGFDSTVDKMPEKMKGKAAAFGIAGAVIGGALMAAIIGGVNDSMDFEQTNANIAAQMGLSETESARVGKIAGQAYVDNYGESVEQVQGVVGGLVSQIEGMGTASDSTVEGMTAKVLAYSSAFDVDASEAINGVSQLMNSGLADSSEQAIDLMTSAMQKVPEALRGDLTDAITEYGPHLASMGYTGEEAFSMLVAAAEGGSYGIDKTGDAMAELSKRAIDMSAGSVEAYDTIGLGAEDMAAKMALGGADAREATDQIVAGLQGIEDPTEKANTAIALFGTPLEDLGVAKIPAFLDSLSGLEGGMDDSAGATKGMMETMGGTSAKSMQQFQRQIDMIFKAIGENLLPILTTMFTYLSENPAVLQIMIGVLGFLALAFMGVSIATWAMNTALLANPITWIVIGIVALIAAIVLLIANWDAVVVWLKDVWDATVSWLKDMLSGLAEWWAGIWNSISEFFKNLWNGIVDWFTTTLNSLGEFFTDLWDGISETFSNTLNSISTFFKNLWQGVVDWFKTLFNGYVSFIMGVVNTLQTWWNNIWGAISDTFKAVWDTLISWARDLFNGFETFWRGLWDGISTFFTDIWENVSTSVSDTWEGMLDFFEGIPDTIMGFFSDVGSWLYDTGRDLVQGMIDGVSSIAGKIGTFFLDLVPGWIRGPFESALGINSPSKVFAEYGSNTVAGYLEGIDGMKSTLNKSMSDLVNPAEFNAAVNFSGSSGALPTTADNSQRSFAYHAAENRSLSAEEDLFAALSSPRAGGGR